MDGTGWRGFRGSQLPRCSRGDRDLGRTHMGKTKAPETAPKSRQLVMVRKPGQTDDRMAADMVAAGDALNACTLVRYAAADHGELSLTDLVASLREQGAAVNRGDLSAAELMLNSQAVALNAIFAELARRAALNMGTLLPATETYLRLALKAQSQSRATVETLAAIKNPPVVFARQANIAHGPQQVNNRAQPLSDKALAPAHTAREAAPRARQSEIQQTELLGASDGERMDLGAPCAAGEANPQLVPVEGLDRPAHC